MQHVFPEPCHFSPNDTVTCISVTEKMTPQT